MFSLLTTPGEQPHASFIRPVPRPGKCMYGSLSQGLGLSEPSCCGSDSPKALCGLFQLPPASTGSSLLTYSYSVSVLGERLSGSWSPPHLLGTQLHLSVSLAYCALLRCLSGLLSGLLCPCGHISTEDTIPSLPPQPLPVHPPLPLFSFLLLYQVSVTSELPALSAVTTKATRMDQDTPLTLLGPHHMLRDTSSL